MAGQLLAQVPGGVREHFQMGRGALAEGRLQDAEESFRKALGLDPRVVEARANLGLALFLQGRYSETVSELSTAAEQRPDLHVAQLFLGLAHLRMGAAAEAIPHLEASLRLDPSNLEARRALSACQLAEGDYAAAVQEFRAAFSATPDAVQGWHALGQDYMRLMSDLAGRLVVGHPDSVWAARLGADMLGLSQAWEAAATYFGSAIGRAPGLPGLNAAFGAALLRLGRVDEARSRFEAELRVDPLSEQARAGLAELAIRGGDPATALQHVASIRDSFPAWLLRAPFPLGSAGREAETTALAYLEGQKGAPSAFLRWRLSTDRSSADAARQDLEAAVRAVPRREPASADAESLCADHLFEECVRAFAQRRSLSRADLLLMGRAYLALGAPDRAIVAFTHAMRGTDEDLPEALYWTVRTLQSLADSCFREVDALAPGSWRAHQLRAEAHRQRQADAEAIAGYRKAINLKPDEPGLHRSLGLIYLLDNDLDEAETSLRRALELDDSDPRTLYFAGRLFIARQQHAEAVPYLEAALRIDPNLVEARPSLGRAYLRVGRFREAAEQLERALVLDYYGDIHYSLFQAHVRLGNAELARAAVERSAEMRKRTFSRDRDRLDRWIKSE